MSEGKETKQTVQRQRTAKGGQKDRKADYVKMLSREKELLLRVVAERTEEKGERGKTRQKKRGKRQEGQAGKRRGEERRRSTEQGRRVENLGCMYTSAPCQNQHPAMLHCR